ncbi:S28 family serine protease [Archangium sp.]|jgi:hypothetical protein|uniref:S28 family serine protease n=1 Tax=Archangium sp. TaxID=1872627 RepID=UPI002EDA4774
MTHAGFFRRSIAALAALLLLQACGDAPPAPVEDTGSVATSAVARALADAPQSMDMGDRLRAIPGMRVVVDRWLNASKRTRFFVLEYAQPADHQHPQGERFPQRMTLLYRASAPDSPVVLYTSGYNIYPSPWASEVTQLVLGHQLTVEHRFFASSTPASRDWKLLTIEQAAADHHRIVQALRPLFSGKWVSTGGSKDGMTAVYHRSFYPDDVDATVPYVAPNSHGDDDVKYSQFLDSVGPDAGCRARLREFQHTALQRREELMPFMVGRVATGGETFDALGMERAFEFAVLEAPFYFWQYGGAGYCPTIPAPDAPAAELFDFLDFHANIAFSYGDAALETFQAYYHQAATQLGAPRYPERHLQGLLRYPRQDIPANYPPLGVEKTYSPVAQLRVKHWVRDHAQRMLFIYGANDPWSSHPYEVRERNDAFRFFVPEGNHFASLMDLPEPERTQALERLFTWVGVAPSVARQTAPGVTAEVDEIPTVNPAGLRRFGR